MKTGRPVGAALVAVALAVAVPSAEAVTFRFGDPALVPDGPTDTCFNGDRCGETLSFTQSGLNVTASAFGHANAVIQDLNPGHAGLGAVWHREHHHHDFYRDSRGDEVNRGQGILLEFNEPVLLGRVRFRDEDHDSDFDDCATFRFSTDGETFEPLGLDGSVDFGGLPGQSFYFKYGGSHPEDFYIARIIVEPDVFEEPVPEPGTMTLMGAGLLGLLRACRRSHS